MKRGLFDSTKTGKALNIFGNKFGEVVERVNSGAPFECKIKHGVDASDFLFRFRSRRHPKLIVLQNGGKCHFQFGIKWNVL